MDRGCKDDILISDDDIFLSESQKEINCHLTDSKQIHDHMLDQRGVVSPEHRCINHPSDKTCEKKETENQKAQIQGASLSEASPRDQTVPNYQKGSSPRQLTWYHTPGHACCG